MDTRLPISIIIPVYNVEKYLYECVKSVLSQDYEDIEIILVDDGSTDKSGQICDELALKDNRIVVVHQKNGGLSSARNTGIRISRNNFITFIDSDDFISRDYISILAKGLISDDVSIVITNPVHFYDGKEFSFYSSDKYYKFDKVKALELLFYQKKFLTSAWGKLYKKELFNDIQFPLGMWFEDNAIMYKLFSKCDFLVFNESRTYAYRHRENSITTSVFSKKNLDILDIVEDILSWSLDENKKIRNAAIAFSVTCFFRIYLNAPSDFYEILLEMKEKIKKYAIQVFLNPKVRMKLKFSLLLFPFGRKLMLFFYNKIERWS